MIILFTGYDEITDDNFQELFEKLPPKRQRKVLRFRSSGGRISCVAGYLVFLYGFRKIYRQNGSPEFAVGKNGKPYLKEFPDIYFNISHCNGAAAGIFSDSPVGIDIQDVRGTKPAHIRKVCSEEETRLIDSSDSPSREFCRIWSVKEAVSKLDAEGIFRDIRNVNGNNCHVSTLQISDDKFMSAACESSSCDFSVKIVTLSDLLSL